MALKRRHRTMVGDDELELVPVMNMFLVLIPFLLLSASFYHIKAINTSVPVVSSSSSTSARTPSKSEAKVTVIVELKEKTMVLTAMCDELSYNDLVKLETEIPVKSPASYPMDKLSQHLHFIKDRYPKSDTLILVPTQDVVYGTIIQTMDTARSIKNAELFPNVVLSGKVG